MKCPQCGQELLEQNVCPNCNYELPSNATSKNTQNLSENAKLNPEISKTPTVPSSPDNFSQPLVLPQGKVFCKNCGSEIKNGMKYCAFCGKSIENETDYYCTKCFKLFEPNEHFCANCGNPRMDENMAKQAKQKQKKKKIVIICLIVLLFLASCVTVSSIILPKIFISYQELLEQGEYEKAYRRASKEEKEIVLYENIIAEQCEIIKGDLKNPDSFVLNNVWISNDESKRIVLDIGGTNSYGGIVNSYYLITYDKDEKKYEKMIGVSDFDHEETSYYDTKSEALEKILKNACKTAIYDIINNDENKIKSGIEERINKLNKDGKLKNISLIEEVVTVYPSGSEKDT